MQKITTVLTACYALYLSAACLISIIGTGEHPNLFVYLAWFFPTACVHKLVNASPGRVIAMRLLLAPPVIVLSFSVVNRPI